MKTFCSTKRFEFRGNFSVVTLSLIFTFASTLYVLLLSNICSNVHTFMKNTK